LEAAIRALGEGLVVGAPSLLSEAWRRPAVVPLNALEKTEQLTGREIEVLGLMARGLANKQIAGALGISEHTVKFHLSSIYAKLGATGRAEAVSIGTRLGLIGL
jgi:DNA-binding CsgD family transcriptional regulator